MQRIATQQSQVLSCNAVPLWPIIDRERRISRMQARMLLGAVMAMIDIGWRKDLDALKMRGRRYHDLRRTFISLALADGARRDVLERVTHQALATRAIDLYTTLPWAVLCEEVAKLDIRQNIAVAQLGSGGSHNGPTRGVLQSSYSGRQEA